MRFNRSCACFRVTANTFNLEGVDTTDTIKFPAGAGIGSVREITGWAQILQIATATSGGDMQFATISHLESDNEYQIPTQATPVKVDLTINDDPTLAGYIAVKAAAKTKSPTPYAICSRLDRFCITTATFKKITINQNLRYLCSII